MLPPHLRKFSTLYATYGLGAVKNVWLLTCLLPLARTVNLNKLKDYVGGVLENERSKPDSHYKRLIRFFQDWGNSPELLHDLMRHNLRFLRNLGFKTLVMDGTSWTSVSDAPGTGAPVVIAFKPVRAKFLKITQTLDIPNGPPWGMNSLILYEIKGAAK